MPGRPVIWFLVAISVATLRAQQSQPNPGPTVRTFRFAATDGQGKPVVDLHPDDLRISDAGKRGSLVFSRFASIPSPPAAPLLPQEFANRTDTRPPASTLILLDLFNADFAEHSAVCQEIIRTLSQMKSPAPVYFFLLAPDSSLFAIHAWPPPGSPSDPTSDSWTSQIGDLLGRGLQTVSKLQHANTDANFTHRVLADLGARYAELPGQKRLIWITRGMPLMLNGPKGPPPLIFQTLLQQTGAEFRQFGIPIYTVHQKDTHTANVDRNEALDSLASLTGGRSFENEAAARAIAEAQTDSEATYLAGFDSPANNADNKFHKLKVSTTRKSVRILAPSGYTAEPLQKIAQNALELAESSAFDTPDIGLRVGIQTAGTAAHLKIYVDPEDFLLESGDRAKTGKLLLSFVYLTAAGTQTMTEPVIVGVNLTTGQFNTAMKDGYLIDVDQTFPADTTKVRIVVQDAATGIAGSLLIPVAPK